MNDYFTDTIKAIAAASYESGETQKFYKWLKNGSNRESHFEAAANRAEKAITSSGFFELAEKRITDAISGYLAGQLSKKTGLNIEKISEEGIAKAISARVAINGFELHSLSDKDQIEADIVAAAAAIIFSYVGWVADEEIKTTVQFINELEKMAVAEIEKRVQDLVLHRLEDVEKDVADWATKKIREKTGAPITDINDIDKTKKEVIDWAFDAVRRRLKIKGTGGGLKMTNKAIRNRRAQRTFYAKHGNVKKYIRKGSAQ